jgi:hypothetical protein
MELHSEIMNIPVDQDKLDAAVQDRHWTAIYKFGHRDARHAAAELSLKAEARIEELEEMLSRLVKENDLAMPNENYQWMYSPMRVECLKVLEGK